MKLFRIFKLIFITFLFLSFTLIGQIILPDSSSSKTVTIGWISNPEIRQVTDEFKDQVLGLIDNHAEAIIITGKISFDSKPENFKSLYKFIRELPVPVKILPSYDDLYSTPYSELNFNEYFDDRNFIYLKDNIALIGMNMLEPFSKNDGHFKPDEQIWLKDELENLKDSASVFLFSNYTPGKINNWRKVENLFSDKFIPTIFLNNFPDEISNKFYFIYPMHSPEFYLTTLSESRIIVQDENMDSVFVRNFSSEIIQQVAFNKNEGIVSEQPFVKRIWMNDLQAETTIEPTIYNRRIYLVQNDGLLSCFDRDGSLFWDYDLLADVRVSPAIIDGYLVVSTLQGDLTSINASNGDQFQTIGFETPVTTGLLVFEFPEKVNTMVPKTSGSKGVVVFGDATGKIACYDIETFEKVWENQLSKTPLIGLPVHAKNQIFFLTEKSIYSVSVTKGTLLWSWSLDDPNEYFSPKITTDNSKIFLTTNSGKIISIDKTLGKKDWISEKYKAASLQISQNGKYLLIKEKDVKFDIAKIESAKFVKSFPIDLTGNVVCNNIENSNHRIFVAGEYSLYRINQNQKYSTIISSKFSRIVSFKTFGKNKLLILNSDGKLALFSINE